MKRLITITAILLLTSSCGLKKGISASFAKEFCSCFFVEGKDKNFCKEYASYIVPVSNFDLDEKNKLVQASFLFTSSLAEYKGQKFGCRLEK